MDDFSVLWTNSYLNQEPIVLGGLNSDIAIGPAKCQLILNKKKPNLSWVPQLFPNYTSYFC